MPVYCKCSDTNKQELAIGDMVHHQNGYAIVVETRGARAVIQFTDGTRLYSRGVDLIKMS